MNPLIIQARYAISEFTCAQLSGLSDGVRPFRSRPGAASYAPALSDALKGKNHIDVPVSAERITRRMIAGHLRTLLLLVLHSMDLRPCHTGCTDAGTSADILHYMTSTLPAGDGSTLIAFGAWGAGKSHALGTLPASDGTTLEDGLLQQ